MTAVFDDEKIPAPPLQEMVEGRDATEEEIATLDHVVDRIPFPVYVACLISMVERFSFYGFTAPLQNYMQNSAHSDGNPGALGLGQSTATRISYAFYAYIYLTSLPWAIAADSRLGRYKTLIVCMSLYVAGFWIIFGTSTNAESNKKLGLVGLIIGMALIGLGVGGVKSTLSPFIADQYPEAPPRLVKGKNGKFRVATRTVTIQFIYNLMYLLVNMGALSGIATPYLEKKRGFWAAFLLPACTLTFSVVLLYLCKPLFVDVPPQGNVMTNLWAVYKCAAKNGFKLDAARPEVQMRRGNTVNWTNTFIDELKRVNLAARVLLIFPLVYLIFNQTSNNFVSQAGQMENNGFPNDLLQVFNPLACIIFAPFVQLWLYPFLLRRKIPFGPLARMSVGFVFMAAGAGYAAFVQSLIYNAGPCYKHPRACPASPSGEIPNHVNMWIQLPSYVILAVAETFAVVSSSEYAYTKAPKAMKSVVQAIGVLTTSMGSTLGIAISPAAKDPNLTIMYAVLSGAMGIATIIFVLKFFKFDRIEEQLNEGDMSALNRQDSNDDHFKVSDSVKSSRTNSTFFGGRESDSFELGKAPQIPPLAPLRPISTQYRLSRSSIPSARDWTARSSVYSNLS